MRPKTISFRLNIEESRKLANILLGIKTDLLIDVQEGNQSTGSMTTITVSGLPYAPPLGTVIHDPD